MNKPPEELFKNPEQYIPEGVYCYDYDSGRFGLCPFWSKSHLHEDQENGYCHYLGKGDWEMDNAISLLWDQCKECGINIDYT